MGSCFSQYMGERLLEDCVEVVSNPTGLLYNPYSIAQIVDSLLDQRLWRAEDLFEYRSLWHSPYHHSDLSGISTTEVLSAMNSRMSEAIRQIHQLDALILTFGTAYVYLDKQTRECVANCHKLPASAFIRERLCVDQIVSRLSHSLDRLLSKRPGIQIILTVSPIRHWSDGAHENQISKSILHLAINRLEQLYPQVVYFPSYELLLDELRDYRWYADDMLHPSSLAQSYIYQRFEKVAFSDQAQQFFLSLRGLRSALSHRPLHPQSEAYKQFRQQTNNKIHIFIEQHPYLAYQQGRLSRKSD